MGPAEPRAQTVGHPEAAAVFLRDAARARGHDQAVWWVRQQRDAAARAVPDWEALRERAEAIKAHTASRLADYLEEFAERAGALGARVHWACDGASHNRIVHGLLAERGATRLVKSKSMLTEECGLNPYLEARGIEVIDTDLGERIVQLNGQAPSHIVMPAIHLKRSEIGDLFHRRLGTAAGLTDPKALTEAARQHLRQKFLSAQAGLTGVNFAIAETGGLVVVTNEGNADMGTALPPLHIASMGIEKVIPRAEDLGVFLRLLARSATGQAMSTYTSHFHGPRRGGELHIVIVDAGRTALLRANGFRRALHCIRCGACLNTCPVYRRSGGYSYTWTLPGPIGSVLAPSRDATAHQSLPFASSLCGSCSDVCPVRIDLHDQLLAWRRALVERKVVPLRKRAAMRVASLVLRSTTLYRLAGALARLALRALPHRVVGALAFGWARQRELPVPPRESFRAWYRRTHGRA
jgi:L-lactate dehydrogenase complex protein LldF